MFSYFKLFKYRNEPNHVIQNSIQIKMQVMIKKQSNSEPMSLLGTQQINQLSNVTDIYQYNCECSLYVLLSSNFRAIELHNNLLEMQYETLTFSRNGLPIPLVCQCHQRVITANMQTQIIFVTATKTFTKDNYLLMIIILYKILY